MNKPVAKPPTCKFNRGNGVKANTEAVKMFPGRAVVLDVIQTCLFSTQAKMVPNRTIPIYSVWQNATFMVGKSLQKVNPNPNQDFPLFIAVVKKIFSH